MTTRKLENDWRRALAPWVQLHCTSPETHGNRRRSGTGPVQPLASGLSDSGKLPDFMPQFPHLLMLHLTQHRDLTQAWLTCNAVFMMERYLGCPAQTLWFSSDMHVVKRFCLTSASSPINTFSPQIALITEWGNCFTWWKVLPGSAHGSLVCASVMGFFFFF